MKIKTLSKESPHSQLPCAVDVRARKPLNVSFTHLPGSNEWSFVIAVP
jgi:hypothetical protein